MRTISHLEAYRSIHPPSRIPEPTGGGLGCRSMSTAQERLWYLLEPKLSLSVQNYSARVCKQLYVFILVTSASTWLPVA